jgi:hypothetical protein
MDKLTADNASLKEASEELRLTIAKLAKELEERDAVLAENYATIQQLRRRIQDAEKHRFVYQHKAETYAAALEPQEKEVARLQAELEGHGKELLGQMGRLQAQSRHLGEKDSALRSVKGELQDTKDRAAKLETALTALSQARQRLLNRRSGSVRWSGREESPQECHLLRHDPDLVVRSTPSQALFDAMQQPDDRGPGGKSVRQKALDALVRKCVTRSRESLARGCLGVPSVAACLPPASGW